jgi:16S rRNA processing protein RimM
MAKWQKSEVDERRKTMSDWFTIGKVTKPQGVNGEVRVLAGTDFPEKRFAAGNTLYLSLEESSERLPLTVASHRKHKQFDLLKFEGYHSVNDVERWRNGVLSVPEEQLGSLDEGEFYYHEIIGCTVISEEGDTIGNISDILETGANDVWVVQGKRKKDILIPYIDEIVKEVDVKEKIVKIHLMEGLVE